VDVFAYAFGGGNDEDGYFLSEGIGGSRYRDLNVSGDRFLQGIYLRFSVVEFLWEETQKPSHPVVASQGG